MIFIRWSKRFSRRKMWSFTIRRKRMRTKKMWRVAIILRSRKKRGVPIFRLIMRMTEFPSPGMTRRMVRRGAPLRWIFPIVQRQRMHWRDICTACWRKRRDSRCHGVHWPVSVRRRFRCRCLMREKQKKRLLPIWNRPIWHPMRKSICRLPLQSVSGHCFPGWIIRMDTVCISAYRFARAPVCTVRLLPIRWRPGKHRLMRIWTHWKRNWIMLPQRIIIANWIQSISGEGHRPHLSHTSWIVWSARSDAVLIWEIVWNLRWKQGGRIPSRKKNFWCCERMASAVYPSIRRPWSRKRSIWSDVIIRSNRR